MAGGNALAVPDSLLNAIWWASGSSWVSKFIFLLASWPHRHSQKSGRVFVVVLSASYSIILWGCSIPPDDIIINSIKISSGEQKRCVRSQTINMRFDLYMTTLREFISKIGFFTLNQRKRKKTRKNFHIFALEEHNLSLIFFFCSI